MYFHVQHYNSNNTYYLFVWFKILIDFLQQFCANNVERDEHILCTYKTKFINYSILLKWIIHMVALRSIGKSKICAILYPRINVYK